MADFKVPNWPYSERERTSIAVAMLESGSAKTTVDYGSGPEDCSASDLAQAKERLLQFDSIIEVFEELARA